jgi:hypothetical protein
MQTQYTLPEWAQDKRLRNLLAGPDMPTADGSSMPHTSDSGSNYNDFLNTVGFYPAGTGEYSAQYVGNGDSQGWAAGNHAGFNDMLKSTGQSLYEAGDNNQIVRWMEDANGNITAEPQVTSTKDRAFGTAALAAGALVGGAAAGLYGGAGAGGAAVGAGATEATIGTLGTIAPGSGVVAPLTTTGLASTAPAITAAIPTVGGAVGAAGAAGAAGSVSASAGGSTLGNALTTGAKAMSTADWLNAGLTAYSIANQPKTPDTSGINQAATDSAALSRDALNWFTGEMERTKGQRDATAARDDQIAGAQLEGMQFATQEAKELAERRKTVFDPVENKLVADAVGFDTPGRRAQAVAEATADVEGAAGRALQANSRALMRTGATLEGPAAAALMQDASLDKARAVAGATGAATRGVEQQGWARMSDAAALGKGTVGNQATQQQIATSAGGAGVNAGAGGIQAATSGVPTMQAGFNTGTQALQTAGQLFGQAGQLQSTTRGQDYNLLSSVYGSYMRSSEKVKKGTGKVTDGKKELDQVMATPVDAGWQYDPAKGGPDDGGQIHTGPMAENVRATMGDKVAPGGEGIDMKAMGGTLMAAIQAVTRDVAELRDQLASRAKMTKPTERA